MLPHVIIGAVLSIIGFTILQINKAHIRKWRKENPDYVARIELELGKNFPARPYGAGMTAQIAGSILFVGIMYLIIALTLFILK